MVGERREENDRARGVRRVSPSEAKNLLDLGYHYVDVRSVEEFDALHPSGAINVPVLLPGPHGGVSAHTEFLTVMARLFPRDAKIVVGCATGMRSLRAAELLLGAGFTDVVDQRAGMDGVRSAFGGLLEPGWTEAGLPVSSGPDAGSFDVVRDHGTAAAERARS